MNSTEKRVVAYDYRKDVETFRERYADVTSKFKLQIHCCSILSSLGPDCVVQEGGNWVCVDAQRMSDDLRLVDEPPQCLCLR